VKCFDIILDGQIRSAVPEADLKWLFRDGRIGANDPCRVAGSEKWSHVGTELSLPNFNPGDQSPDKRKFVHLLKLALFGGACFAAGSGTMLLWQSRHVNQVSVESASIRDIPAPPLPPPSAPTFGTVPSLTLDTDTQTFRVSSTRPRVTQPPFPQQRPSTIVAPPSYAPSAQTPPPLPQSEEFTIPLDQWYRVNSSHGNFSVKIHDWGIETISVCIDSSGPFRIEKGKGFERDGTNVVEIYRLPYAKVYYVDRVAVGTGRCVLKVTPNN